MDALVLAEQHQGKLASATLACITAAQSLAQNVHVLLTGNCEEALSTLKTAQSITKIIYADHAAYQHGLAENIGALISELVENQCSTQLSISASSQHYDYVIAPATTFGKNCLPRAAALLGVDQISDVIEIVSPTTFKRMICAGNAIETVESLEETKLLSIRPSAFEAIGLGDCDNPVEKCDFNRDLQLSTFVKEENSKRERPELTDAKIVISGGRGLQSAEHFRWIEELADLLGGAVGASRAAVDAGFVSNDFQVGQTGKVIAPDLYIGIGISGAVQHLAGMKDSRVIVAINKDRDAPLCEIADYSLMGDLFDILPELKQAIIDHKKE